MLKHLSCCWHIEAAIIGCCVTGWAAYSGQPHLFHLSLFGGYRASDCLLFLEVLKHSSEKELTWLAALNAGHQLPEGSEAKAADGSPGKLKKKARNESCIQELATGARVAMAEIDPATLFGKMCHQLLGALASMSHATICSALRTISKCRAVAPLGVAICPPLNCLDSRKAANVHHVRFCAVLINARNV